jgi:hypothetical protein
MPERVNHADQPKEDGDWRKHHADEKENGEGKEQAIDETQANSIADQEIQRREHDSDDVVDKAHKVLLPLQIFLNLFVEPGFKLRDELTVLTAHIGPGTGATPAFHGALDFADHVHGGPFAVWTQGNGIAVAR